MKIVEAKVLWPIQAQADIVEKASSFKVIFLVIDLLVEKVVVTLRNVKLDKDIIIDNRSLPIF